MLLLNHALDREISAANVLVFHGGEEEIGKVVESLKRKRALQVGARGAKRVGGNLDVLSTPQFPDRFQYLGLIKFENEMDLLSALHEVVAFVGLSELGLVQSEALAIAQQKRLYVPRRTDFKCSRTRGQHKWAAGSRLDFDGGRLGGRFLDPMLWLDAITSECENHAERDRCKGRDTKKRRLHWTSFRLLVEFGWKRLNSRSAFL